MSNLDILALAHPQGYVLTSGESQSSNTSSTSSTLLVNDLQKQIKALNRKLDKLEAQNTQTAQQLDKVDEIVSDVQSRAQKLANNAVKLIRRIPNLPQNDDNDDEFYDAHSFVAGTLYHSPGEDVDRGLLLVLRLLINHTYTLAVSHAVSQDVPTGQFELLLKQSTPRVAICREVPDKLNTYEVYIPGVDTAANRKQIHEYLTSRRASALPNLKYILLSETGCGAVCAGNKVIKKPQRQKRNNDANVVTIALPDDTPNSTPSDITTYLPTNKPELVNAIREFFTKLTIITYSLDDLTRVGGETSFGNDGFKVIQFLNDNRLGSP